MRKCTLIFTPNDAVLDQWEEALIASGVEPMKVKVFNKEKNNQTLGNCFLLATKSNLNHDMKHFIASRSHSSAFIQKTCRREIVDTLSNLYGASKGFVDDESRNGDETYAEAITRHLKDFARKIRREPEFEFLIFDESQELKNVCSLCGKFFYSFLHMFF